MPKSEKKKRHICIKEKKKKKEELIIYMKLKAFETANPTTRREKEMRSEMK